MSDFYTENSVWKNCSGNYSSQDDNELLVFGYSCRLFKDDEKATFIEQGNHLIPWMGDSSLMIDRYDVRGALYDLCEAETTGELMLTEKELEEEGMCDYERYLFLYQDEQQTLICQEEENKRLHMELNLDGLNYSQVGFNYTATEQNNESTQVAVSIEHPLGFYPLHDDAPFIPPPELFVPFGMTVPETIKQNRIIIKTSKFIASQGAQMEILIKAKQAGNPMFGFLSFDHPLYNYYKHVVSLIRNGRPIPENEEGKTDSSKEENDMPSSDQNMSNIKPDLTPGTSNSLSGSVANDCAYSQLISKIKETQKGVDNSRSSSPCAVQPGSVVTQASQSQGFIMGLVDYPSFNQSNEYGSDDECDKSNITPGVVHSISRPQSKQNVSTTDYKNIKWPPPHIQMVIDKMASYIIKNGPGFELIVKNRGDARFDFLKENHEYYPYYRCKLKLYREVYGDMFVSESKASAKKSTSHAYESSKLWGRLTKMKKGLSSSVSFSIKSKEQDVPLDRSSTFPVESSTSEEEDLDEREKEKHKIEREERRRKRRQKEKEKIERREREKEEEENAGIEDVYDIFKYAQEMNKSVGERDPDTNGKYSSLMSSSDSKKLERKLKAAQFLSKLKVPNDEGNPVVGPHIPPEIASYLLHSASQSPISAASRTCSRSRSRSPEKSCKMPPPVNSRSRCSKSSSPSIISKSSSFHRTERENKSFESRNGHKKYDTSMDSNLSLRNAGRTTCKTESGDEENWSRHSRRKEKVKKHRHDRSESRSPKRDRKKRKRSRSRKKKHSRSRSVSEDRYKSHRSRKKRHRKHNNHKNRERNHRKKKRHQRSPSPDESVHSEAASSSSSVHSSTSSISPPAKPESDEEVQILKVEPAPSKNTKVLLKSKESLKSPASSDEPATTMLFTSEDGIEDDDKNAVKLLSINIPKDENQMQNSSAMEKIAKDLRAKVHAMLEKDKA